MKTLYLEPSTLNPRKGFTLIEIIVVVAVISVLSLVAFASFEQSRQKARDTARYGDLEQISAALTVYGATHGRYPDNLSELVTAGLFLTIPEDPINTDEYIYAYTNNNNCYELRGVSEQSGETIEVGNCSN